MVGSIALAVLAIMGVRGSLGRFRGLYTKFKTKLPVVEQEAVLPVTKRAPSGETEPQQPGLETRGYKPKPGERSQTRQEYEAQGRQARVQGYDPKTRTDAQLAKDLEPTPRPSETPQQAQARVQAAKTEIDARTYNQAYAKYGETPPKKFRITDNDGRGGGAHTLERHGADMPLKRTDAPAGQRTVEGRIFGDPPWPNRQNFSLKWLSDSIMDRAVRWALENHWNQIRAALAKGEDFAENFNYPQAVGEGFYNAGTNTAPRAVYMKTSLFRLTIVTDSSAPRGIKVITTFPNGRGY
jgi:hypothetical protein